MLRFLAISCLVCATEGWVSPSGASRSSIPSSTQLHFMLPETATSLIAGSIAGAVGVGVAYPLDTIKTKQQVEVDKSSMIDYSVSSSGEVSIISKERNLFSTVVDILRESGPGGFYGGVQTSMLGQALIKSTAFSVNAAVLEANSNLAVAAATAGFVTAFLAVPVDRIKVLMQTDSYNSEYECLTSVLESEGLIGLLSTGLVPTLFREVPAYTLYFYLYGTMMSSAFSTEFLGAVAPLVSGALAGAACVVPVHPVDVVKTIVQHSATAWQDVVADIYEGQGMEGFWEGLAPRMSRAAVNHSVTFATYDFLMHQI